MTEATTFLLIAALMVVILIRGWPKGLLLYVERAEEYEEVQDTEDHECRCKKEDE